MKVLVVDDTHEGRAFLQALLGAGGHEVVLATNGVEALDQLHEGNGIDLIIADIRMPRMDGFELCREVKKREGLKDIPFVFYSATYTDAGDEILGLSLGASRFIVKPLGPAEFTAVIEEVLRDRARNGAAQDAPASADDGTVTSAHDRLVRELEKKVLKLNTTSRRLKAALEERNREFNARQRADEATTRLAAIVEFSEDAIIATDASGLITSWNRGAEALLGYPAADIVGAPYATLVPPEHADEESGVLSRLCSGERVPQFDTERLRKDGKPVSVSASMSPVLDRSGRVIAVSTILRDITERKRAEIERERLLQETQEAVRARDDFLSVASHELNTPVTALLLSIELLRIADPGREERDRLIARVERQGRRLSQLADELLDVTRLRGGKLQLDLDQVDLAAVIRMAARRLAEAAVGPPPPITLDIEGPVIGMWDRARLDGIVSNLLSNAVRFGQGEPITASLRAQGGVARMEITDHGIGIAADRLGLIFDPFERAVSARNFGGLGLGLFIVRRGVEALGGTVHVHSEVGAGSTFSVELPLEAPMAGERS